MDIHSLLGTLSKPVPSHEPKDRSWHAFLTIKEMLVDGNYEVSTPHDHISPNTIDDWIQKEKPPLLTAVKKKGNEQEIIYVFWDLTDKKLGVKSLRQFVEIMDEHKVSAAIIVSEQGITPSAVKELGDKHIRVFDIPSLYRNISRHAAVPKHRALSDQEVTQLCKERKLQKSNLPIYSIDDPIVRYYGYRPGTVVEIDRRLGGSVHATKHWRVIV
jgi:DNA-directed RNA polymerase I, II, and III subunit RPABC1